MKATSRCLEVLALGPILFLAGCSGGSGGGGAFEVVSCSLGCTAVQAGGQVGCSVTDVAVNQEIRIAFNQPVDLDSVTSTTFKITELGTGRTPNPSFRLDPNDPRILIYRPTITINSSGVPSFGFTTDSEYTLRLDGRGPSDPGPFIRSTGGRDLGGRMSCRLIASLGVADLVPGFPRVRMFVDVNENDDPNLTPVLRTEEVTLTAEPFNAFRDTQIRMVFDDLMNPAALVDQVTGQSPSILVNVDADGDISDPSDQVAVLGDFSIDLDELTLRTTVTFTPLAPLPSRGLAEDANPVPIDPRKVVVTLPFTITDLAGNPLANFGNYLFVPEQILFDITPLGDDFTTNASEDTKGSGGLWNSGDSLQLTPGFGGGSGRHGALFVPSGETIVLNTDSEDFSEPIFSFPGVLESESVIGDPISSDNPIMGGVFEFSELEIEAGGVLILEGSNPGRLLVRGELNIDGQIQAAGSRLGSHDDRDFPGGPASLAGPGGGAGGKGGDRPDGTNLGGATCVGADPPYPDGDCPPELYADVNGGDGLGVPIPSLLNNMGSALGGEGGVAWPQPGILPDTPECPDCSTLHMPTLGTDTVGIPFDPRGDGGTTFQCRVIVPGGVGAGGGNGSSGTPGVPILGDNDGQGMQEELQPLPPVTIGGQATDLLTGGVTLAELVTLDPELGLLRGGGGGGGSGAHLVDTESNGVANFPGPPNFCAMDAFGNDALLTRYISHSSGGGGGGGGGVQLQAGSRLFVGGSGVDVSGAMGARRRGQRPAMGGGGGAGGSLLFQSRDLQFAAGLERVFWGGGIGGLGAFGALGGDGGVGRLRFESPAPNLPDLQVLSPAASPSFEAVEAMGITLAEVATVGDFQRVSAGPSSVTGSQSCWLQPEGNFFILDFQNDFTPSNPNLGWDMSVVIDDGDPLTPEIQSWRGENDIFMDTLETTFGNDLGTSPVVVLFQGARALSPLTDPCNVDSAGADEIIAPGSLTGWVKHPTDLNAFFSDPSLRSNMIRFLILFDQEFLAASGIEAIDDITILARPD